MWRPGVRRRWALALLLGVALSGCAGILRSFDLAPNGLTRSEDGLRRQLAAGRFEDAIAGLARGKSNASRDELLRLLHEGITLHYAGRYAESSAALDRAAELAEDRYTRSVSRGVLSLVTNDLVLPFQPSRTERLLIHYYSALNYLRWQDTEGAAVEARRLSLLLQHLDADAERSETRQRSALLRYFAGTIFAAAGESNDAAVAFRNAQRLSRGGELPEVGLGSDYAGSAASGSSAAPGDSLGEVVVLLERGFVAHRVEQSLVIPLYEHEVDALREGRTAERLAWAGVLAGTVLANAALGPAEDLRSRGRPGEHRLSRGRGRSAYLLKVAWPVYRRDRRPAQSALVVGPDDRTAQVEIVADLSDAVIADFEANRAAVLTRAIARAATKYLLTERASKQDEEDDDGTAAQVAGTIANIGGVLLEQADTRSWHLLPGEIGLARLPLPSGRQPVTLRVGGPDGAAQVIDLGTVDVRAGEIAFLSTRIW